MVLEEVDLECKFQCRPLWKVMPTSPSGFAGSPEEAYPYYHFHIPSFVRFGTWMGGDRDGNPFVTAQVTAETLRRLRRRALKMHIRQARRLTSELTHSELRVLASDNLKGRLEQALWQWPRLQNILGPRPTRSTGAGWP